MRFLTLVLVACALGALSVRATELISLPVMDPPKSDARRGENVFNLLPRAFQNNPQFEMTIKCALTAYGHTFAPATPSNPVYYVIQDAGRLQLGERMDRETVPENLDKMLIRALSTNGYLPAEGTAHRPSLLLIYRWGSSYAMDHEAQLSNIMLHYLQSRKRSELIGEGYYTRPGLNYYSRDPFNSPESNTQALNSLYFATITAYDHDSVARGKPEQVWRTYLTANAQGVSMSEALPALVLTAGTSFGRDTHGAQFVTRRAFRGKVEMAPLVILPDELAAASPRRRE